MTHTRQKLNIATNYRQDENALFTMSGVIVISNANLNVVAKDVQGTQGGDSEGSLIFSRDTFMCKS